MQGRLQWFFFPVVSKHLLLPHILTVKVPEEEENHNQKVNGTKGALLYQMELFRRIFSGL